jgi:hypothetical protein
MINQSKLTKLIIKQASRYSSTVTYLDDIYKLGLSKHACMVMELLLLNKPYSRIQDVLLFTSDSFEKLIDEIYMMLKNFKARKKMFQIRTK